MEKANVLVVGCNGRMGQLVCKAIAESEDFVVVAGYDVEYKKGLYDFPIFTSISELAELEVADDIDAVIDFSRPAATMAVLDFAIKYHIPTLIATTGFSDEEEEKIRNAAKYIPIFKSDNMSYGVNVVVQLLKLATKLLDSYDIAISEFHHAGKADAPSGTAKRLFFNTINEAHGNDLEYSYGSTGKKKHDELWVASQRGGNFSGEHVITFAGANDFIRIVHFAHNAKMFADGALNAARYLLEYCGCAGYYTMDNMFKDMQDN